MKKNLVYLLFTSLVLAIAPLQAAEHGLMTVDSAWVKAMLANDAEACAALYADDAVLVLPGTGPIKGRKAIAEAYAGWLKEFKVTDARLTDGEYRSAGTISSGWGA
jgi:ketosteroid isomerase-like protein